MLEKAVRFCVMRVLGILRRPVMWGLGSFFLISPMMALAMESFKISSPLVMPLEDQASPLRDLKTRLLRGLDAPRFPAAPSRPVAETPDLILTEQQISRMMGRLYTLFCKRQAALFLAQDLESPRLKCMVASYVLRQYRRQRTSCS